MHLFSLTDTCPPPRHGSHPDSSTRDSHFAVDMSFSIMAPELFEPFVWRDPQGLLKTTLLRYTQWPLRIDPRARLCRSIETLSQRRSLEDLQFDWLDRDQLSFVFRHDQTLTVCR